MFVVCLVDVWQRIFEPVVCVCVRACVRAVRRAGVRRTVDSKYQSVGRNRSNELVHNLGPTQFPIKGVSGTVFPAANRPEGEDDHSHSSTIDVTYEWNYTFTSTCLHDAHRASSLYSCLVIY